MVRKFGGIKMENLNLNSVIIAKKEIAASDMDGETVMLSIETGKYYNLGQMGGAIWSLIENPIKIQDIINKLMEEYNVTKTQCEEEVLSFVNELYEQSLIEII